MVPRHAPAVAGGLSLSPVQAGGATGSAVLMVALSLDTLTLPQAVLIVGLVFAWLVFVIARAIGER